MSITYKLIIQNPTNKNIKLCDFILYNKITNITYSFVKKIIPSKNDGIIYKFNNYIQFPRLSYLHPEALLF